MKKCLAKALAFLACSVPMSASWAYFDFYPTPTEFASWPEYCAAQYVFIMEGRNADVAGAYSPATIANWRSRIGDQTFLGMHHFCSSIHYLNRAKAQRNPDQKKFLLTTAQDEVSFSLRSADQSSIIYPDIVISFALIKREQGDPQAAVTQLQRLIEVQPQSARAYVALAMMHKQLKQLPAAREALIKGNTVMEGNSSDIQYNLGLINLELGDVSEAVENAKKAYALGYPLPWLKDKLRSMGKWPD